ncbi:MAG: SGNH/GDSL hydrolase family protein [Gammaproteobacteria bacterium]
MESKPDFKGNLRSSLLLMAASLIVAFLLAEITLRVLGISYPSPATVMQKDYYRGFSYTPDNEWLQSSERPLHLVVINSEGFNDRIHELKKPPGYFRIAVLGDSYTAAIHVERKQRFTEIIEKELNRRKCFSPRKVEVMNFGVSDYGTAQELMVLRNDIWKYHPDMVILVFWPANDLDDNLKELSWNQCRPYTVIRDGKPEFDYSFRSLQSADCGASKLTLFVEQSRVLQLGRQAYTQVQNLIDKYSGRKEEIRKAEFSTLMDEAVSPHFISIYHESNDEKRRQSWVITDKLISIMNRETREKGVKFFVVSLGTHLQETPDMSVRKKLLENTGTDTLFYPGNRIKSIGQREGFAVLDLAPPFQQFADKNQIYMHNYIKDNGLVTPFGHWNVQGHKLAAQIISDELCQKQ